MNLLGFSPKCTWCSNNWLFYDIKRKKLSYYMRQFLLWQNFILSNNWQKLPTSINSHEVFFFSSWSSVCMHGPIYCFCAKSWCWCKCIMLWDWLTLPFHNGTEKIGVYGGSSYIRTLHESYHKPWKNIEWIPSQITL